MRKNSKKDRKMFYPKAYNVSLIFLIDVFISISDIIWNLFYNHCEDKKFYDWNWILFDLYTVINT